MSNPVPSNLALTTINNGDTAQSAPLRNNFAAIQTAQNQSNACLGGGTAGQVLQAVDASDVQWAVPSGHEIGYDQFTAPVPITGTAFGAPTTVIAGSAYTFDGSPVMAEFCSAFVSLPSTAGGTLNLGLYEGSTLLSFTVYENPAGSVQMLAPGLFKLRFTPSAGSHTYSIKSWVSGTTGTPQVGAGTGSAGSWIPAYLRLVKV